MIPKSTDAQVSYKMVYSCITYAHPLLDIKSSLYCLRHHKCYVNRCQYTTDSSFAFWNFLVIFSDIFYSWLVESVSAAPVDMKEYMCSVPSRVPLFAAAWTGACQAPLSMGFSRQEDWSGLPCPPSGDPPNLGMQPPSLMTPAMAGGFFTTRTIWEAPPLICLFFAFISFTLGDRPAYSL